jgi:hypothetical protein
MKNFLIFAAATIAMTISTIQAQAGAIEDGKLFGDLLAQQQVSHDLSFDSQFTEMT